jgi:acyl-CoA-dependent ceramide synthase
MAFLANASIPSTSTMESLIPPSLRPYVLLSYPVDRPAASLELSPANHLRYTKETLYKKGPNDVFFAAFCAIAFTALREVILRGVLKPFANYWLRSAKKAKRKRAASRANGNGVGGEKGIIRETKREERQREHTALRFAEQGWSFLYCTVFWTLGTVSLASVYIMAIQLLTKQTILLRIPNRFSPESLWSGYPHTLLPALTKFYYLAQLGWWFHQLYVIHSEKPRKDHWQMFAHHILSITLIVSSYYMNYTRIGTVVHVFMDFCDILLPVRSSLLPQLLALIISWQRCFVTYPSRPYATLHSSSFSSHGSSLVKLDSYSSFKQYIVIRT